MGLEDDGTPPANGEGLLSSEASSLAHLVPAAQRLTSWGSRRHRPLAKGSAARRKAKAHILPKSSADSLDLVQMLEESWFWRSSTASPSTSGPTPISSTEGDLAQRESERNGLPSEATGDASQVGTVEDRGRVSESRQAFGELARPSTDELEPLAARRTQSDNIDEFSTEETDREDPRAHSFAHGTALQGRNAGKLVKTDPALGDPLGTWAQRVFRFGPGMGNITAPTHIPGTPEVAELRPRAKLQAKDAVIHEEREDDDAAVEAAWRWRFNRRWRTEQAKQLDPSFGLDGDDEDGWDTALGYLEACGPGYHLQVGRTTSLEKTSSLVSDSSDFGNFLMDDSQKDKSALKEQAELDATKSIVSVAKKARDLYQQQQKIERDVQTRWGNTKVRMSWAGQHIEAVRIDTYGKFVFILAKVSDRTSAHRLLVRGRNGADKSALIRALTVEVQQTCKQHNLAPVSVVPLGSGTMEWSRERDHRINITSGRTEKGCDPGIQKNDDVTRLAGALTRASLLAPNRVSINGEKLS